VINTYVCECVCVSLQVYMYFIYTCVSATPQALAFMSCGRQDCTVTTTQSASLTWWHGAQGNMRAGRALCKDTHNAGVCAADEIYLQPALS
jgi:hypothetical protein